MAGIVIALGDKASRNFDKIKGYFEDLKGLNTSCQFSHNKCYVAKYKRKYDDVDNNYFQSDDVIVCAIGSILYKNYGFGASVRRICKSLSEGAQISNIVHDIDGNFCLLIVRIPDRKCYIITDAGGAINAYLVNRNGTLFISTSMLALARTFNVTPDSKSILTFIRTGMFFDDATYFKEISTLKAASIYEYDIDMTMDQVERKEYWRVPSNVIEGISLQDAGYDLIKALFHIIDKIPNEDSIYDFTGGYDSRFVIAFAYSKVQKKSINAFFFGPPNSREAKIVRNNCINLGITYNNYLLPDDWPKIYYDYVLEANDLCDGMINACEYAPVIWILKKKEKEG